MASFWLGLVASKMSAVCLTQITFGAAGISGGMQVKDGYTVIKSVIKSFATSVTAPHGFVTWISSKALNIEVIANESKRDIFTRSGNHVAYFMADDAESFRDLLSRATKRADDRIQAANELPNDQREPELKAIKMALKSDTVDHLEGREHCVIALSNIEFSDCVLLPPPPRGWTHEIIDRAINCNTARAFRAKWDAVDVYVVEATETGLKRHWSGSSEPY